MSNLLFTATATTIGGREGSVKSSDGVIDTNLAMPGTPRKEKLPQATNPEQLFASGYSACFGSALENVAKKDGVKLDPEVTANVSLLKDESDGGFKLAVKLQVKDENTEKSQLEELVKKAHEVCPYSKATKGNIDVELEVL
ncbi:organic hydroperoxide resistance protein [Bacillus testis]|uniref:organic hydroperoxide resistance protein n=1 Tax=Bacillus testis TaxID=1622072 RepID=UPI00067E876D|nr:organic hydroperoxide resistance protein [Bacillus testis]